MPERIIVKGEGITLDLLLWREHGYDGQKLLEEALALNPGLARLGPIIPLLTPVWIPDLPAPRSQLQRPREVVDLGFG